MGDSLPEVNFDLVDKIISKARSIFGATLEYSQIIKDGSTYVNLVELGGKYYLKGVYFINGNREITVMENGVFVKWPPTHEKKVFSFNSFEDFIRI